MPTEMTLSFDQVTRRVAKHFKSEDEMREYFAAVFHEPDSPPSTRPAARERRQLVDEYPAVAALNDFMVLRRFMASLSKAREISDDCLAFTIKKEEAGAIRNALEALSKLANTEPGPAVLFVLARLLPREVEPNPDELAKHVLTVLTSETGNVLRQGICSFMKSHQVN